jgi:hypothetical protein
MGDRSTRCYPTTRMTGLITKGNPRSPTQADSARTATPFSSRLVSPRLVPGWGGEALLEILPRSGRAASNRHLPASGCPVVLSGLARRRLFVGWIGGDGGAVATGGGGGAGQAAGGGGADQAPDPARGALGLRLLHAPECLPKLRARHPAARPRAPQCSQYPLTPPAFLLIVPHEFDFHHSSRITCGVLRI